MPDETEARRLGEYDGWRDRLNHSLYDGWQALDRLRLAYWHGYAEGREERRRRHVARYGWWCDVVGLEPGRRVG